MKTILHHYNFNNNNNNEKEAYSALRQQLAVSHAGKFFNVLADTKGNTGRKNESEEVELDTNILFENQWNEIGGGNRRLFDWYEGILPNKRIKQGHWLEITPEMQTVRDETLVCGYCGKFVKVDQPHKWHCGKCLGSQYLKEDELGLLRLLPVSKSFKNKSFDLTAEEKAEILPLYKEAQGLGLIAINTAKLSYNRQKIADLVPEAEKKCQQLIEAAKIETKAFTWLLDHEMNIIENTIYYNHTGRFCFGWCNPLSVDEKSKLLDILSEFPFDYDIK